MVDSSLLSIYFIAFRMHFTPIAPIVKLCSFDMIYRVCNCLKQFSPGHVKADTRQHDTAYTSDKSSLSSCVSSDEKSSSEEPTCEQIEECPSFDLGF